MHNSSTSTPAVIEESFAVVAELGADTVLAPISWALLEPEEGRYDFTLVDAILRTAREQSLAVVPLWFGTWKNGMSSYAPVWVKRQRERFPRARTADGEIEHLSPFSLETSRADAAAFAALMSHLAASSASIPLVQVENEVGLLGDSRDRSALAEAVLDEEAPTQVIAAVAADPDMPVHSDWVREGRRSSGSWRRVFGESPSADEAFMAHAYASYIQRVAAAGRARFDVPLAVNAWLDSEIDLGESTPPAVALAGGQRPGVYPSGGPLPQVAAVWRVAAPSIDLLAPDIYFGDFDAICARFSRGGAALLVPEMRRDAVGVAQMFRAFGSHRVITASPFGVDSLHHDDPDHERLRDAYRLLRVAIGALDADEDVESAGFVLDADAPAARIRIGGRTVSVEARAPFDRTPPTTPSYGIVVATGPDELLAIGRGFVVSFPAREGDEESVGILAATEETADGDVRRRLGGDETGSGSAIWLPPLHAQQSPVFPIPATIESTGVVRIALY